MFTNYKFNCYWKCIDLCSRNVRHKDWDWEVSKLILRLVIYFSFFSLLVFFLLQPFVLTAHSISTCSHPTETATAKPSMFTWTYVMMMTSETRADKAAGDVYWTVKRLQLTSSGEVQNLSACNITSWRVHPYVRWIDDWGVHLFVPHLGGHSHLGCHKGYIWNWPQTWWFNRVRLRQRLGGVGEKVLKYWSTSLTAFVTFVDVR